MPKDPCRTAAEVHVPTPSPPPATTSPAASSPPPAPTPPPWRRPSPPPRVWSPTTCRRRPSRSYPAATPIRNRLPRVQGGTGTATNWRQVSSLIGSGFEHHWLGSRGPARRLHVPTPPPAAPPPIATIGEEDTATFEAISAARGFEDIQASMATRLLQKTMLKEEMALLAGNASLQLGTPPAPVTGATGSSATFAGRDLFGSRGGADAGGLPQLQPGGGRSHHPHHHRRRRQELHPERRRLQPLGQHHPGGDAGPGRCRRASQPCRARSPYAWFVGPAGSETLQAITTINSATFAVPLAGGQQLASAVAGGLLHQRPGLRRPC